MGKYLIAFIIGAVLWRIGGWHYKWVRRYLIPFLITAYSLFKLRNKLKKIREKLFLLILFPVLIGVLSLGYGEKYKYWQKFLVGVAWVLPRFFFVGFGWFALAVPFIWIGLFWLSNNKPYSNVFKWPVVEVITGGCVGAAYV